MTYRPTIAARINPDYKRRIEQIAIRDNLKMSDVLNQIIEIGLVPREQWRPNELPKLELPQK